MTRAGIVGRQSRLDSLYVRIWGRLNQRILLNSSTMETYSAVTRVHNQ